jgi:hypothetical protein
MPLSLDRRYEGRWIFSYDHNAARPALMHTPQSVVIKVAWRSRGMKVVVPDKHPPIVVFGCVIELLG